jgi:hypothetical protein
MTTSPRWSWWTGSTKRVRRALAAEDGALAAPQRVRRRTQGVRSPCLQRRSTNSPVTSRFAASADDRRPRPPRIATMPSECVRSKVVARKPSVATVPRSNVAMPPANVRSRPLAALASTVSKSGATTPPAETKGAASGIARVRGLIWHALDSGDPTSSRTGGAGRIAARVWVSPGRLP